MSEEAPRRRTVALPPVTQWPRVGKIRLGEQVPVMQDGRPKMRSGEAVTRPAAIDYFRVDPEDGITSPESAASFLEVYGEHPTSLRCQIPGRRIEDVWEGAYRLYGRNKLKIRCDGVECDERTATGGWETKPCVCDEQGLPKDSTNRCKLGWTLNVLLPDVVGMGVWQITTGSSISVDRVSRWLQMMFNVTGDLLFVEFNLMLVPADVTPDGKTKTVHVLEPRAVSMTPKLALEGGGRVVPRAIESGAPAAPLSPPPADEEIDPDDIIDPDDEWDPNSNVPPPAGGSWDMLWRARLADVETLGLTSQEVAKVCASLDANARAWNLADDDFFTEVMGASRLAIKRREEQGSLFPEPPPTDPGDIS